MEIRLYELKNINDGLEKLLNQPLKIKTSYKLSKLAKEISSELNDLEESRINLVKKYGTPDEEGNIVVKDNNIEEFSKEFKELLNLGFEIDFEPISIDELGDITISPMDLVAIDKFLFID